VLDERAADAKVENERILLIERAEDGPGQSKALEDSAVVYVHGAVAKASILLHFGDSVQGGSWQSGKRNGEASGV
jgi:hypothetical protein